MNKAIYFVGSHGSGKTSLAGWVARTYKIPLIAEIARVELAKRETTLGQLRLDVGAVTDYQRAVFHEQVAAEHTHGEGPYVSDRSADNLWYFADSGEGLAQLVQSEVCKSYIERMRRALIFFVHPHGGVVPLDTARPMMDTLQESQQRAHGGIKMMLEWLDLRYCPVLPGTPQERQRLVGFVLDGMGYRKID